MVQNPEEYQWSSYLFYIGNKKAPEWLHTAFILGYFGEKESIAQERYRRFVNAFMGLGYESPLKDVVSSTLLGSPDFISHIKETFLADKKLDKDFPALRELAPKASMQDVFNVVDESFSNNARLAKNVKTYLCQKYTGEKLRDIGIHFGIS